MNLKKVIESPAILNLGIVLAVVGIFWDYHSTNSYNQRIEAAIMGIEANQQESAKSIIEQQTTLNNAIVNASASRKEILDQQNRRLDNLEGALERRVEKLENEHRWLSDARQRATTGEDSTVAAFGQAMLEAQALKIELEEAKAELQKLRENK